MYADKVTKSMDAAIKETQRRRAKQTLYNTKNNITPTTIEKEIGDFDLPISNKAVRRYGGGETDIVFFGNGSRQKAIKQLEKLMEKAMRKFDYEQAMTIKEQIRKMKHAA